MDDRPPRTHPQKPSQWLCSRLGHPFQPSWIILPFGRFPIESDHGCRPDSQQTTCCPALCIIIMSTLRVPLSMMHRFVLDDTCVLLFPSLKAIFGYVDGASFMAFEGSPSLSSGPLRMGNPNPHAAPLLLLPFQPCPQFTPIQSSPRLWLSALMSVKIHTCWRIGPSIATSKPA